MRLRLIDGLLQPVVFWLQTLLRACEGPLIVGARLVTMPSAKEAVLRGLELVQCRLRGLQALLRFPSGLCRGTLRLQQGDLFGVFGAQRLCLKERRIADDFADRLAERGAVLPGAPTIPGSNLAVGLALPVDHLQTVIHVTPFFPPGDADLDQGFFRLAAGN